MLEYRGLKLVTLCRVTSSMCLVGIMTCTQPLFSVFRFNSVYTSVHCLQGFDTVGWTSGRTFSLSGEVLAWIPVWSEVHMICIWWKHFSDWRVISFKYVWNWLLNIHSWLGHRLGDDLVDWNSGMSVRTSTKSFSDFHLIWCVGRSRPHMRTSMTSTRSKVKVRVTEHPNLRKVHFSRSIFSAILVWSSKLMVAGHSMGPGLQRAGARFLNFHLGKLSREFKLRPISIFDEIQMAIFR